jgi:selenide, water dikinase
MTEIKLTQYSHGAGCGCKISPKVLDEILHGQIATYTDSKLLVGNEHCDDAAVYDMGDGKAIMSTTDFFMPIVDDPFTFGQIAATNAISDIYAMGGTPLLAIAILGWPVDKLDAAIAGQVLDGGRFACKEAGIALAGGHSIDSPEPIFGLAVTGKVEISKLKRNDTAVEGCRLYLTKPLGVGILTTAQKQGKLKEEHSRIAIDSMLKMNRMGEKLALLVGVRAMTDVTGFGLLGHLSEMCEGSGMSAIIEYGKIPVFPEIMEYIAQKCIPGGTFRNWQSYGSKIKLKEDGWKSILCDPQTSGGLLIAAEKSATGTVEKLMEENGLSTIPIGRLIQKNEYLIQVT